MVTCNHRQNTNGIACDLAKKMKNYFKKGRDVSVSLVTLPCKQ
jgi:hypothetical protein